MKFSVIVCTYDIKRLSDLDECVHSILRQNYRDFEAIIVVDHNLELFKILGNRYAEELRIKVVLNNSSKGAYGNMNYGILQAKGQIICFIDDDAVANENWLLELAKAYDDNEDTWAVGGRIDSFWLCKRPSYLPDEFYWIIGATGGYLLDEARKVRNLWSGNISYRREVFDRVGLFLLILGKMENTFLFFQGEEAEFGLRLLKTTGRSVKYVPAAIVYHKIYSYRIKFKSLLKRAYQQGYSKAHIRKLHNDVDALSMEREYLKLLFKSSLKRLKRIIFGPSRIDALEQLAFTFIATTTVFLGFISGSIRSKL